GGGRQAEGAEARRHRAERPLITSPNIQASRFRQVSGGQKGIERPEIVKNRGALQCLRRSNE
ncbi:hypothetical protein, partial [Thiocapsa sp. UBA6158]|uniref:hypothetical protein n=1 Tax=Thiocapsa sp. UBA6158 TaxID=1947692 RepID=UPI0025EA91C0